MRTRADRIGIAATAIALVGAAALLWMGRGLSFFSDEWAFIERRSLANPAGWLPPHNEHWSTLPVIGYRLLVETVGLGTYVPYLVAVLTLHLLVVWLVYRHVRRVAGPALALGATAIVAILGSGFENLLWGFQTGFVGAVAAGLGALAVLDERPSTKSVAGLVGLLVVGLMTAGIALVFLAAVGLEMLLRSEWRRRLPVLAIPAAIYAAWFLAYGRSGVGAVRDPTVAAALRIPAFVVQGFGNAIGSIVGIGPVLGLVAGLAIVAALIAYVLRGGRLPARTLSCGAAIALLYALIAISRAGVQVGQVDYTRYTYIGVVLAIVGLAPLVGPLVHRAWDGRPRWRPWLVGAGALALVLGLTWNVRLLAGGREIFLERAAFARALVTVALRDPLPDGVPPDRSLVYVPSPAAIRRIVAAHGSPLSDFLVPGSVEAPNAATWARAEAQLRDPQVPLPDEVE